MSYIVCSIVFAAVFAICYFGFVRPLRRQFEELKRSVATDCVATRGQVRIVRERVEMLRKNSGAELEAISQRLIAIEDQDLDADTKPCAMEILAE
jgi:hypothetical protein